MFSLVKLTAYTIPTVALLIGATATPVMAASPIRWLHAGREDAVLGCLRKHGPQRLATISLRTGLSSSDTAWALRRLVRQGRIEATNRRNPSSLTNLTFIGLVQFRVKD